jgi:hypothetical protein
MAEFTDFMNQRVEHFFSMFKELRYGLIADLPPFCKPDLALITAVLVLQVW